MDELREASLDFVWMCAPFIGMVKLLDLFISLMTYLNRHFNRNKLDLIQRYRGSGDQAPWALVTGASDGLGAEYCR